MELQHQQNIILDKNDGSGMYAAFTAEQRQTRPSELQVTIGSPDAVGRFNSSSLPYAGCVLRSDIVTQGITATQASASGLLIEGLAETSASQADYIVIAPHGGEIEKWTDEMAERFYGMMTLSQSRNCSYWHCRGYSDNAFQDAADRWHITSVDISEHSFPSLKTIIKRDFKYGISFHGMSTVDQVDVGGYASGTLLQDIATAISGVLPAGFISVVTNNSDIEGDQPGNVLNRLCTSSVQTVQVEMSFSVRQLYRDAVVDACVATFVNKT